MSNLMPRPSTIRAAIAATEMKIADGYDKSWRYANSYEQEQINATLGSMRKGEHDILQKLKDGYRRAAGVSSEY